MSAPLISTGLALFFALATFMGCASGGTTSTTSTGSGAQGGSGTGTGTGTGGATSSTATGGHGGTTGCATDEKLCGGACVKVDDPTYGCAATTCDACPPAPHAQASCSNGLCVLGTCDTGFKNCDGSDATGCETDTENDPLQCGACGSPCVVPHASPTCVAGKCQVGTCENGYFDCDNDPTTGCEAQPQVDPKNCGACNTACVAPETCELGKCGLYCPKGFGDCNNDESDACETQFGSVTNCAFCGDNCAMPNAQSSCTGGACHLDQCNTGWANCDTVASNGCETNTQTDANNCGACGNVCPSGPHSTAACVNGGCVLNCDPGYANCDNNPSTGCEVHTDVDTANCGSCTHVCNVPNATAACAAGLCGVAQCNNGFADCDKDPSNGCEINTNTNPANCGGCGTVCTIPHGVAGCAAAQCTVGTCDPGWADCDGIVSNGCETNVGGDPSNCGTCFNVCNLPNAVQACTGGVCTIGTCLPGYATCNTLQTDGCETQTSTDPSNCGFCNHQCFVQNGIPGCSGGNCTVGGCNPGYYDVNGFYSDGCECAASGADSTCAAPTASISVLIGQATTYTGNLVPSGSEAWIKVAFSSVSSNYSYHPHVTLTAGVTEFAFDVVTSCGGAARACGNEGGTATTVGDWEVYYAGGDPNNAAAFNAIPAVGTVYIHVYRRSGKPVSCNNFTLSISG